MSGSAELAIDIGHSRVKWGLCQNGQLDPRSVSACPIDRIEVLVALMEGESIRRIVWSPQGDSEAREQMHQAFEGLGVSCQSVTTGSMELLVAPAYPALGSDRWLALQWPRTQTRRAFCVIDCGTAVTVDGVDAHGRHLGGWIMAGLPALRRGLGQTAPRLPDPELDPGQSTEPATDSARSIGRGFRLQLIGGVQAALDDLPSWLGADFDCWLTGGDAPLLASRLERSVIQDPDLVLRGLALAGRSS